MQIPKFATLAAAALAAMAPIAAQSEQSAPAEPKAEPQQYGTKKYDATETAALRAAGQSLIAAGKWTEAAAKFGALVDASPDDASAWHMLGYSLHGAGELDAAMKAHRKAAEFPAVAPIATYNIACVHALRGESDAAIEALHKARELGFNNANQLKTDPDMDNLRSDPRFDEIVAAMAKGAAALQVFASDTPRLSSRLLFWSGNGPEGSVVVDYAPVGWQDAYQKQIDGSANATRWRLGRDHWTTFETSLDLSIAGVDVPAGYYYAMAAREGDGFGLVLMDAARARGRKLDASQAASTRDGIVVPMVHADAETADRLAIELRPNPRAKTKATLAVRFGPHELTAPVLAYPKR